jgi:hypothetical protein
MTEGPTGRMSLAEYARARGYSGSYVSRLKRKHRLVVDERGLVVVDSSDRLIAATRDPSRGGDRTGKRAARLAAIVAAPTQAGATPLGNASGSSAEPAALSQFADSKLAESRERTALLRLDRMEREGSLVDRAEVDRAVRGLARAALEALLSISDRLSAQLAAESDPDKVRALIDAEARHIADALSRGAAQFSAPVAQAEAAKC